MKSTNLPVFQVDDQDYMPDQQRSGDAGFDLRAKVTEQCAKSDPGLHFLRRWTAKASSVLKDRYANYSIYNHSLQLTIPKIYKNGSLILDTETLESHKKQTISLLNFNDKVIYRLSKKKDHEVFIDWFEQLTKILDAEKRSAVLIPGSSKLFTAGFKVALPDPFIARFNVLTGGDDDKTIEIPLAYELDIHARSGLACKHGLVIKNQVGILDSGYRNQVLVYLENRGEGVHLIEDKTRIAQGVFRLCLDLGQYDYRSILTVSEDEFEVIRSLNDRGGGVGSTGC